MNLTRIRRTSCAVVRCCFVVIALSVFLLPTASNADDWPQWMGPQQDNVWRETGILDSFPKPGPKILWRAPIAGGYSGPSVAGGRVVITDYVTAENVKTDNFQREKFSGSERVLCLNSESGELIWKHEYPVKYTVSYPSGPRCTPVTDGDRVYTLGTEGHLFCFDLEKGDIVWSKSLTQEYNTKTALWGYASHPLIDGEKLICIVGGKGSHAVAFNKLTGKELWKSLSDPVQGYSPPKIFNIAGMRQLILFRPGAVSALNPEDGSLYWNVPHEASNGSVIMTPIQHGNLIYAGGFSHRNILIEVAMDGKSAKTVWQNLRKQAISPVNVQPFRIDDAIYGFDQNGLLYCMDIKTGKRLWQSGKPLNSNRRIDSGTAFIIKQGERFWLFNELGELIIAKLSKAGYEELDRTKVIKQTNSAMGREVVWSMPAFANKRAYIRNDEECICVDLAK